ncbi:hypothetical protein F5Y17DRAFT_308445 [Xylariaceae sp. FL0594]|nr:hypothetical protein F5Y17DRAFT_308445 [Xylariaceae sp. FL0594]
MCRVGTVIMASAGCNHARQTGWEDSLVAAHLGGILISRCSECRSDETYCGKQLVIDKSLDDHAPQSDHPPAAGQVSSRRRSREPLSLASLVVQPQPTTQDKEESQSPKNTLDGKCKFCTLYESEIRLADQIKQTLVDYNMALLLDHARVAVGAEMQRAFQHAVDEAVRAYGVDGKAREKALRTLDAGYHKASAEISRLCGEKQLAPYRELYGR